jgi:uncharacterized membrane protein
MPSSTSTKRQESVSRQQSKADGSAHLSSNGVVPRKETGLLGMNEDLLARGLGLFSIGLGLAELGAPGTISRLIGVNNNNQTLIRALGLREIAHGIGILSQKRPVEGVWSRVGGDVIDLACLGAAFMAPDTKKGRLAFATVSVLGVAVLDTLCAQQLSRMDGTETGIKVRKSISINRTPEHLYSFWRDFQNLPGFMKHLEQVTITGEGRSRWIAKAPAGMTVEWEAEITDDQPNRLIAWRSLEGSTVDNSGIVRFQSGGTNRGTIVTVELQYTPPAGTLGAAVAKLFGEEPEQQIQSDLRRFKQLMETGEVVLSDGSLYGTGLMAQRPAQPASGSN